VLASAPLEYGLAIGFDLMDESAAREKWALCLRQCFEESIADSPSLIDDFAKARMEAEDREFFPWMLELGFSFGIFLPSVRIRKTGARLKSSGRMILFGNSCRKITTLRMTTGRQLNGWRMELPVLNRR
jgi:hypothetical protein